MKYISLILDILTGTILWVIAFNFYLKNLLTFGTIFLLLGLGRFDIANLYWKIKNEK